MSGGLSPAATWALIGSLLVVWIGICLVFVVASRRRLERRTLVAATTIRSQGAVDYRVTMLLSVTDLLALDEALHRLTPPTSYVVSTLRDETAELCRSI